MGSRRLERERARHARIAVDAAPLIYFLAKTERFPHVDDFAAP